ncbi:MAG: hypothetical protein L0K22_01985 [Lacticaseibacillus paracasei]|nr:hypothetical protein [Lacticaseibacillus paracasei]MCT4394037.1 hypothetical protein [Lacticaseibacillus paracasei]MDN6432597.1 hypothetical protein [Lacticaseibacillus paracasei]MDN6515168.1 hypothetical protein [Lacticaseibacillus paracasei]
MITKESQLIFSEIFIGNLLNVYFDDNQTPGNNFLRGNVCLSQLSILIKLLEQKEFVFVVSLVKSHIKKDVLTLKGKNVLFCSTQVDLDRISLAPQP